MKKGPIPLPRPERRRRIPRHFSWVDHRLVRDNHLQQCRPPALALYLFLLTVADREGVSYYRDQTICAMLRWDHGQLESARNELLRNDLIAYRAPFYQVLDLDPEPAPAPAHPPAEPVADQPATAEEVTAIFEEWRRKSGCRSTGAS